MRLALTRPRLVVAALLVFAVVALILGLVFPPNDSSAAVATGSSASLLLVGEFESTVTTLSAVQPNDPTQRRKLHAIEHAPGWDIVGATSPDGHRLAYLVLPLDARDARTEASLVVLDDLDRPDGPRARTLYRGADLRGALAWSSDGTSLFIRTTTVNANDHPTFELLEIDAVDGRQQSLLRRSDALGLYPVGRAAQGPTYAVSVGVNGSELLVIGASSGDGDDARDVERRPLSPLITRSWTLSPDGSQLAFTEQQGLDLRVRVAALTSGSAEIAVAATVEASGFQSTGGTASPAWHPDGSLSIGILGQGESGAPTLRVQATGSGATIDSERSDGFALPVAWSPPGSHLAVRAFSGIGPGAPGDENAAVIDASGTSRAIPGRFVRILGWWSANS
jgi:hypothetical protein